MKPEPPVEDIRRGKKDPGVYVAEQMEELKHQMALYEEIFGQRDDGKAGAIVDDTPAAAAATDAVKAGEVGSASSSGRERRWPTTCGNLKLEAEWVIRWVLYLCCYACLVEMIKPNSSQ
jgi:hypothetical protein